MKNKKLLAVVAGVCLFATVGYANNYLISGLGFVAPSIIGKSNIYNPEVGEIVYDQVDATFYGYDHNGQWQALNGAGGSSPAGTILAFGGIAEPSGYLICDGRPVSRTTYGNLFAVIGTAFGEGDGVNTFNLPDLRGRFLRGVDGGAGNDPDAASRTTMATGGNAGDSIGSIQNDEFKGHNHYSGVPEFHSTDMLFGFASNSSKTDPTSGNTATTMFPYTSSTGGNETRPKNVNVNFIIKI